jgi:hypothetical protein
VLPDENRKYAGAETVITRKSNFGRFVCLASLLEEYIILKQPVSRFKSCQYMYM